MKARELKRLMCAATLSLVFITGCANGNTAVSVQTNGVETGETVVSFEEEPGETGENEPISTSETSETPVQTTIAVNVDIRSKFPDAYSFKTIGNGRYIILTDVDGRHNTTQIEVYDAASDTVVGTAQFNTYGEWWPDVVVYEGQGFGMITESHGNGGNSNSIIASYYDMDGNLLNAFVKSYERGWYYETYTLAPDGSALYVSLSDREQCACGFDFKADYVTRIYGVYGNNQEELIAEFDSHYSISIMGVRDDGKIAVRYYYDPNEKVILTHKEYETMSMLAAPDKNPGESGLAFIDPDASADHSLEKVFKTEKYYGNEMCFKGNAFVLVSDDEIVRIAKDANGNYKETSYEVTIGADGVYFGGEALVSSNGKYVIFSTFSEDTNDTTVSVVHFDDDKAELVYESFNPNMRITFTEYLATMFDESNGNLYGKFDDTSEGGRPNQPYFVNIYE